VLTYQKKKKEKERVINQFVYLFRSTFQGKLLKHNLDSEVVDALKDLRKQLSENESKTQSSWSGSIYVLFFMFKPLIYIPSFLSRVQPSWESLSGNYPLPFTMHILHAYIYVDFKVRTFFFADTFIREHVNN
jgi:hypothetical protein